MATVGGVDRSAENSVERDVTHRLGADVQKRQKRLAADMWTGILTMQVKQCRHQIDGLGERADALAARVPVAPLSDWDDIIIGERS